METGSHWQADQVDWDCIDIDTDADHPIAVVSRIKEGTRKRLYEHGEDELEDREMDKMYKRDYWEDLAYASLLELAGLSFARAEAVLCFSDRTLRATDAMLAQRRQEREEQERRSRAAAHESEPAPARAAAGDQGRQFFCFWRSIVDNLAALRRYFLG